MKPTTCDPFLNGRLKVRQHRDGYRFSLDSVLLAGFARFRPGDRVVDLGAGCGIVALVAALLHPRVSVVAVEIQPDLAALARANAADNQLANRVTVIEEDLRRLKRPRLGAVNHVLANPPYHPSGSGRLNPDDEKAAARHEILANLGDFIAAGRRLLDLGGRFSAVYPSERGVNLVCGLSQAGLEPKRLRLVHPAPGAEAGHILVEAVRGAKPGLHIEPPLFVRERAGGPYHPEVAAMLRPLNA
ncbi:MAG TPA: methyltransferase domain-containing protein [Desulfobacteraceae bacterium]|nr:methyltransferase domain-containing protein [Desulfobacteraceae bacterium]